MNVENVWAGSRKAMTDSSPLKESCPEVNLPTRSSGGTGPELMTCHNEVFIPCLGPLSAGSLGPKGYSEQSRSPHLNFSIHPSICLLPSLSSSLHPCLCFPLRSRGYGTPNPSAWTHGTMSRETGDWHRLPNLPKTTWQTSYL